MMNDETGHKARLLIVDDEPAIRSLLTVALGREDDYDILEAVDGIDAQDVLQREPVDVVITDLAMPRMDGEGLMHWGREHRPDVLWIILTGQATMQAAIDAVRLGAFDFVPKGSDTIHTLPPRVRNAVCQRRHQQERQRLQAHIKTQNVRLQQQVNKLRDACELLRQQTEIIQEDFCRAADIQRALLPREAPNLDGLAVDAVYRPSDRVGGDLYDVVKLDEHRLGVCVADAAGHGVAAAMLAVIFKSRLSLKDPDTGQPLSPAVVLGELNRQLVDECRTPRMFVSACYGIFDIRTGQLAFASAGHPPALIHRNNGDIQQVEHSGPALGLSEEATFKEVPVTLQAGERVLLYTDGLFQAASGRAPLTPQEVCEQMLHSRLQGIALLQQLLREATEHQQGRQLDDITLLMLSLSSVASEVDNGQRARPSETSLGQDASGFELSVGRDDHTTVVRLRGQADWTYASTFHEACSSALAQGRELAVDLAPCPHLDSTFLGTIHELVTRAEQAKVPVALYGVGSPVRALFEELGMQRVLSHVAPEPPPLPECSMKLHEAVDEQTSQQRILHAHETLAALNEENHQQFAQLVEYLRQEIESDGHAE
jgi:sigma-B regulation protein RsbU (phosphoserine phosphatase)